MRASGINHPAMCRAVGSGLNLQWKKDGKDRTRKGHAEALYLDSSAMFRHDLRTEPETEAGACIPLCADKRLEEGMADLWMDPGSGICDRQTDTSQRTVAALPGIG